ncbi:MAG: hypothetical protein Kow0020_07560 [Wenzhouxiangellaceae bacterium]
MLPVVVIPVFNAVEALDRCLRAVQATVPADAPVIVIDDASTDPAVGEVLGQCPAHWQVHHQPVNRGFVASANLGMSLAGRHDVVLLNSDTVPAGDWLRRLAHCLASADDIASATPFTNNGEIASLPEFCRAAPVPADPERWARACVAAGPPEYPEIPTAVGFCMAIRRAALDRVGGFDARRFGRGYGEENDWSLRARAQGWRHVLCDDAFVAHQGNASFGPLGLAPDEESMRRLLEVHPGWIEEVRAFIENDPLAPVRHRVLAALAGPARP